MNELMDRFREICLAVFPDATNGGLNEGASDEAITKIENEIGLFYPPDLKAAYKFANGSSGFVFPTFRWLALHDEVSEDWQIQKRLAEDGRVAAEWASIDREVDENGARCFCCSIDPRRIPFANDGASSTYYLDMNPASGGQKGQVIEVNHGAVRWWAPSFRDFIARFIELVDSKELYFSPDANWDVRNPDLSVRAVFSQPWVSLC